MAPSNSNLPTRLPTSVSTMSSSDITPTNVNNPVTMPPSLAISLVETVVSAFARRHPYKTPLAPPLSLGAREQYLSDVHKFATKCGLGVIEAERCKSKAKAGLDSSPSSKSTDSVGRENPRRQSAQRDQYETARQQHLSTWRSHNARKTLQDSRVISAPADPRNPDSSSLAASKNAADACNSNSSRKRKRKSRTSIDSLAMSPPKPCNKTPMDQCRNISSSGADTMPPPKISTSESILNLSRSPSDQQIPSKRPKIESATASSVPASPRSEKNKRKKRKSLKRLGQKDTKFGLGTSSKPLEEVDTAPKKAYALPLPPTLVKAASRDSLPSVARSLEAPPSVATSPLKLTADAIERARKRKKRRSKRTSLRVPNGAGRDKTQGVGSQRAQGTIVGSSEMPLGKKQRRKPTANILQSSLSLDKSGLPSISPVTTGSSLARPNALDRDEQAPCATKSERPSPIAEVGATLPKDTGVVRQSQEPSPDPVDEGTDDDESEQASEHGGENTVFMEISNLPLTNLEVVGQAPAGVQADTMVIPSDSSESDTSEDESELRDGPSVTVEAAHKSSTDPIEPLEGKQSIPEPCPATTDDVPLKTPYVGSTTQIKANAIPQAQHGLHINHSNAPDGDQDDTESQASTDADSDSNTSDEEPLDRYFKQRLTIVKAINALSAQNQQHQVVQARGATSSRQNVDNQYQEAVNSQLQSDMLLHDKLTGQSDGESDPALPDADSSDEQAPTPKPAVQALQQRSGSRNSSSTDDASNENGSTPPTSQNTASLQNNSQEESVHKFKTAKEAGGLL
ncbi:hypothetical protein LTS18_004499, partial [Coniosporium uncinatum]